jgi:hypothetical protein
MANPAMELVIPGKKYYFQFAQVKFEVIKRAATDTWHLLEWKPTLKCWDFLQEFDSREDAYDWVKLNF